MTGSGCFDEGERTINDDQVYTLYAEYRTNSQPSIDHCDVKIRATDSNRRLRYFVEKLIIFDCGVTILIFDNPNNMNTSTRTLTCDDDKNLPIEGTTSHQVLKVSLRKESAQSSAFNFQIQVTTDFELLSSATCPGDVFKRVHGCLKETGVISAALQSIVNPGFIPPFCGLSNNSTLDCLQDNLDLCADNPRLALLKLLVDPQRSHDNLRYFCKHRHVLKGESNCTRFDEVSTCTQRAASKLKDTVMLTTEIKPVLDTQCLYNDDLLQCFTGSLEDRCNGTRQLYVHLTTAMRFPYCDLDPLKQHVRLHDALSKSQDGSNAGSGASNTNGDSPGSGSASLVIGRGCCGLFVSVVMLIMSIVLWDLINGTS
ncbi:uncharacterized protein [Littorina saxatilis]